jgi:long-chain acyl-CoA synthetase
MFFNRIAQIPGEFLIYDDGYRGSSWSYRDVARIAQTFRSRLRAAGVRKGHTVMIWSESRPGWLAALWACILEGIALVPVEAQSSVGLFHRIRQKVEPRLILRGDRVPVPDSEGEVGVPVWLVSEIENAVGEASPESVLPDGDDIAEIVFTSGTTGEPKGVIITHRNLAANLRPIEEQFAPYLRYVRPFAPLRILNLLPMSHLFGQALATFVPPLIPASVIFISSTSPQEVSLQIRRRRACVLVSVPRVLEVLRRFIVHRFPTTGNAEGVADQPWPLRWWRFRDVHRLFGWKFCCVVSGGAPLPPDLEAFWTGLGYAVVQGYGLTETAPIISFNHPFHIRRGSVGMPLAGVDVKVAADGEVLVRGGNVSPGYYRSPAETSAAFQDGWLYTGDIGELTSDGRLVIKGRKKEMIVTPEGLKVFPEDVETVLSRIPGVRDSAVVGGDRVHAVLVTDPGADAATIVRAANEQLEDHQKIRSFSIWTAGDLPRTTSTGKLRRRKIAEAVNTGTPGPPPLPTSGDIVSLLQRYAPGRAIRPDTTLNELGLGSLDRVELLIDLEEKLGTRIDEGALASAQTVGDLAHPPAPAEQGSFPAWNRGWIARALRRSILPSLLLPLCRALTGTATISGLENLATLTGPLIFAANHQSYLDTPVILGSLSARWRYRVAPAMWKEYFDAWFHPDRYSQREHRANGALYGLLALLFNTFPVPQTETGTFESVRYMGELVEEGWSILIFPEGERSWTGTIGRFLPGVGMIASRLRVPVVPVRLLGVDRVWQRGSKWPRFSHAFGTGAVEVRFGAPISPGAKSYSAIAEQVEDSVRRL